MNEKRKECRRNEDRQIREQIRRHQMLFEVGQVITSEMDMEKLFEVIIRQTDKIMVCQRTTVFLYEEKTDELWSFVATGLGTDRIRIPAGQGIAGWVFRRQKALIIPQAYEDSRFLCDIDRETGFCTRNILSVPLINRRQNCIGVLQALNKINGDFSEEDLGLLTSVSHYVAVGLENAKLYEELRVLDKAKEKVIHHLSHELKTPLAIISGAFDSILRKAEKGNFFQLEKTVRRGKRNVERLLTLQEKIDDILQQKSVREKDEIIGIIEDALSFTEELSDEYPDNEFLQRIIRRLDSIYHSREIREEKIAVLPFLEEIRAQAAAGCRGRDIRIFRRFEAGPVLFSDRDILGKVFGGLLKNAVENTPDGGQIEIRTFMDGKRFRTDIRDSGTGITEISRKMIFGGFIHTQETLDYSSKQPYAFNAGGAGSDLLRIRVFSERLHFSVCFESRRCPFLPKDADLCPGNIFFCPHLSEPAECLHNSGSLFSIIFPAAALC